MEQHLNQSSSETPCFVICPYCNSENDYGQQNANLNRGEEDIALCLVCKKYIKLISIGGALKGEKI